MKEYVKNMKKEVENMKEYIENMYEYVENMKEYVENMKEYVENMKEYEEICQYIGFGTPISIWALGLEKFQILPLYIGLETWKNSTPSFLLGSRTWKNFDLHPYIYIGL